MNDHEKQLIFSSKVKTYGTPRYIFDPLNEVFNFQLDTAADESNSLCKQYYCESINALEQRWNSPSVWCNPRMVKKQNYYRGHIAG